MNSDLDPREGNFTAWITATKDRQVLALDELASFAARVTAPRGGGLTVRVTHHETLACISVRGDRERRNRALELLADAFYDAGYKWTWTKENFDWLRAQLKGRGEYQVI